jgi:transcriptional regulator with XRE-family HTH domain
MLLTGSVWCHDSGMMGTMDATWRRLIDLVADAREAQGLDRPIDLAKATGLSKSTIHRFEKEGKAGAGALRAISWAVRWTPDSAANVLAGGDPTPATDATEPPEETAAELERRYEGREVVNDAGRHIGVVEDAIYELFVTVRPDAPFGEYDKTRRRVLEALSDAGIDVAERHEEASSRTGENA